jgi:hypothetical protein
VQLAEVHQGTFYNPFGSLKSNLFSARDELFHKMRHRQMAHGFSTASLLKMEYIFNRHVSVMVRKVDAINESERVIDPTALFKLCAQDTNGELSFSMQYDLQEQ